MRFEFTRNTIPLREIYKKFNDQEYIVDDSYQRRKVWGDKDNVRLIETILLNLVVPEIFLWPSNIDPETGDTITHIVDGQQRINAIVDFLAGVYPLKKTMLLTDSIQQLYGDYYFDSLPPEKKRDLWTYSLSIVNIDKNCTIEDVKDMFYRLNITDYRLNEQEIRSSQDTVFGRIALELSRQSFWDEIEVFSGADVKRMKDVEYCGGILILADEGIVDQTTSKKLNQTYDDYKSEYPSESEVLLLIHSSMNEVMLLKNDITSRFLSRKTQLYTMFSFIFYINENEIKFDTEVISRFTLFVNVYNAFKNDISEADIPENLRELFKLINSYRLASSEGVNKLSNRMLRFEIMKKICLENDITQETFENLCNYLDAL